MKAFLRKGTALLLSLFLILSSCILPAFAEIDNYTYRSLGENAENGSYYQALYDLIYTALLNKTAKVRVSVSDWPYPVPDADTLDAIYRDSVLADHPELFWAQISAEISYSRTPIIIGDVSAFTISFSYYKLTDPSYQVIFDNAAQALYDEAHITDGMSEFEKALRLHEVICNHFEYVSDSAFNQSAYSGIVNYSTVCAGYARSYQHLLHMAGIDATYAGGFARDGDQLGERHGWIFLKIDGEYYYTDITWDDNFYDNNDIRFYGYFDMTYEEMNEEHALKDVLWTYPTATSSSASYYVATGSLVDLNNPSVGQLYAAMLRGQGVAGIRVTNGTAKEDFFNWFNKKPAGGTQSPRTQLQQLCGHASITGSYMDDFVWLKADASHVYNQKAVSPEYLCEEGDQWNPSTYYYSCKCGARGTQTFFDGTPHVHSGGVATCQCSAVCAECQQSYGSADPHNHVGGTEFRNGITATCTSVGYEGDVYCLGCGERIASGAMIPKDSHNHVGGTEVRNRKPVTLREPGYTGDTYCLGCGEVITSGEVIPVTHTNHTESTAIVGAKIPTCCEPGYTGDTYCAICGILVQSGAVLPVDHSHHVGSSAVRGQKAATCTAEGYTGDIWCTACGLTTQSGAILPMTPHVYDQKVLSSAYLYKAAGCTSRESYYYSCVCGAHGTKFFPVGDTLGHIGGTATCCHPAVCERCHKTYGDKDPKNHEGGTETRNASAATRSKMGYTGDIYCVGCAALISRGTYTDCLPYVLGDADNNDTLNSDDVILLLRHTLFPEKYPIDMNMDYTGDNLINSDDVILLLRHILFPDKYPLHDPMKSAELALPPATEKKRETDNGGNS